MSKRRPPTPEEIREAVLSTQQAADLLGIQRVPAHQLLHRHGAIPVLTAAKGVYWLKSDVERIARERKPGPPTKPKQETQP